MKLISREGLVNYMEHRGFKQAELARQAGLSPQMINHLVRGERDGCSPDTARRIERALNAPPNSLFSEKVSRVARDVPKRAA